MIRWSTSSAAASTSSCTQRTSPGELAVLRAVVVAHRRRGVRADVGRLVGGEEHRHRAVDAAVADLLAVEEERDVAALPEAAAVVGELHPHLVLAGGDLAVPVDLEPLQAEEVVAVRRLAVLDVEREAAEGAALGDDHALGSALRHLQLRP